MFAQSDDSPKASNLKKPDTFQDRSPSKRNNLNNLYEQLRETNVKLKERPSQGNSMIIAANPEKSVEKKLGKLEKSPSMGKLKVDDTKKIKDEKLEKLKAENQKVRETVAQVNLSFRDVQARNTYQMQSVELFDRKVVDGRYEGVSGNNTQDTVYRAGNEGLGSDIDPQDIDIARDYLMFSSRKRNAPISASQQDVSLFSDEDKYPQVKFWKRHYEFDHAKRQLQEQVCKEIKKLANSKKMSQNSYQIMIRKLESSITSVLLEVDKTGRKLISFEQMGRIFNLLEIFRVIKYDANFNLEDEEQFFSGVNPDQKRRFDEMVIHEEVWKLIANNEETEYVDIEFLYIFLRILLDPANLTASETAKVLQEEKIKMKQKKTTFKTLDFSVDNYQLIELIKNFKKLTENRLYYNQIGYLKPEKAEEVAKKNEELTFKPKISQLSQAIDRYHTQRFLEQQVLEEKERSPVKQGATKENPNILLFDLKRVQSTENPAGYISQKDREYELETSKRLSNNVNNRVEILYKRHEAAEKKKNELRKMKELESLKECTFQPSIKNYTTVQKNPNETIARLHHFERMKRKKEEERIMEQIQKETAEMEKCTFKPEINSSSMPVGPKELPKGFEKNVIRMRYAIDETKKKKEALEKKPAGENYEKIRNAKIKPPSFIEKPRQKREAPFVFIEINVAPGRTGRIGIHEDDDPRILAHNFSKAFQITEDMERNLEDIITQQLQDHFTKKEYQDAE